MTMSVTTTIDPPEPPGGPGTEYPISALTPSYITDYVNQATYQQKTGNTPPAYRTDIPTKTWVDVRPAIGPVDYLTIHLDPSMQHAVETSITVSQDQVGTVNIPPDTGPQPPSIGTLLVPKRALQPDEQLIANPFGISVQKTTNPTPPPPGPYGQHDRMMLTKLYNKVVLGIQ